MTSIHAEENLGKDQHCRWHRNLHLQDLRLSRNPQHESVNHNANAFTQVATALLITNHNFIKRIHSHQLLQRCFSANAFTQFATALLLTKSHLPAGFCKICNFCCTECTVCTQWRRLWRQCCRCCDQASTNNLK